jgi:hypothetical protein
MAARVDRLVFIRPDREPWQFDARELQEEWVERINGGEGRWGPDNVMNLSGDRVDVGFQWNASGEGRDGEK